MSPPRGDHAPEPIDMPFSVLTLVLDIIIPAKFYVYYWFLRVSTPKSAIFLYFLERPLQQFCTTVQTVIYAVWSIQQQQQQVE